MPIKRVYSLEEYIEAIDELFDSGVFSRYSSPTNKSAKFTGVDWRIEDLITLSDPELETVIQKPIIEDAKKLLNVYCKEKDDVYEGILIGLCITEEDCYWMLKDAGKIRYLSCVSRIERKYPEYES